MRVLPAVPHLNRGAVVTLVVHGEGKPPEKVMRHGHVTATPLLRQWPPPLRNAISPSHGPYHGRRAAENAIVAVAHGVTTLQDHQA